MNRIMKLGVALAAGLAWTFSGLAATGGTTENRQDELALRRAALAEYVALAGADALPGVVSIAPEKNLEAAFKGSSDAVGTDSPDDLVEDAEVVTEEKSGGTEAASIDPTSGIATQAATPRAAVPTAFAPVTTINVLRDDIYMDIKCVSMVGYPSHYVCSSSSGTLRSSCSVTNENVVSIAFEVTVGSGWLRLSNMDYDAEGHKTVTYTALSNVGGASRYGIIKCRERYYLTGGLLAETVTWYPIGQCGDWIRHKKFGTYSANYSVLCYNWASDSGNGTGFKTIPIDGYVSSKEQFDDYSSNPKLIRQHTNVAKRQVEHTYFANMTPGVKSCWTITTIKGGTGRIRTWHFVAPKPEELLDMPQAFTASDTLVTNVVCSWNAVEHATSYKVFRNGVLLGTTVGTTFRDATGKPGTVYTYSVVAEASDYGTTYGTSPAASDKGKSVPLAFTGLTITPYPATVHAGRCYRGGIGCVARYNDGTTRAVRPTWSVRGAASINKAGDLRVGAGASGTLKVTATYTALKVTKKATVSIQVVRAPLPDPTVNPDPDGNPNLNPQKRTVKLLIDGPDQLTAGETGTYAAVAVAADGSMEVVVPTWRQLTGGEFASARVDTAGFVLTVASPLFARKGTLIRAEYAGCVAVKRVDLLPEDVALAGVEPRPVLALDGDRVAVCRVSFRLPVRVDSGVTAKVSAKGLPPGLAYDAKKGAIAGVPTKAGNFKVTVSATSAAGKAVPVTFTLKVLALPGWAVGTYDGVALFDRLTAIEDQTSPYAKGTVTVSSTGKISAKLPFSGDTETLSASAFSSATLEEGKVVALGFRGTLKTRSGNIAMEGTLTRNVVKLGVVSTVAAARRPSLKAYRRLTGSKSDWTLLRRVANRRYRFTSAEAPKLVLSLRFDRYGNALLSGKTATGRTVKALARVLVCDGNAYVFFLFPATSGGGNGFFFSVTHDGSDLQSGYVLF